MKNRFFSLTSTFLLITLLFWIGCTTGPKYVVPKTEIPDRYKETGDWSQAQPSDDTIRGEWWKLFGDAELNDLENQVNLSNQNIASSFAAYQQARAIIKEARSQYFPSVSLSPAATVQSGASIAPGQVAGLGGTYREYSVPATATWAPDLWGKIRNSVKSAIASAQMSAADLESERLLEQSDLAIYYYELRAQDTLQDLYHQTLLAYKKALELTVALSKTGIDSDEAVAQAETQLQLTEAQSTALGIARAQYEHAIALLVGKPASSFSLPIVFLKTTAPKLPVSLPSRLLERRPDIAASERSVAAANAQIGVATAAYFPNLTLNAGAGIAATSLNALISAPVFIWSLGGSLSETLFDGGLRDATVEQYKAAYEQTVAVYRETVLTAFQQVEDALAGLRFLSTELSQQNGAVDSAKRYLQIANSRYQAGIDPYLNVITAQTTVLSAEQTQITIKMQQLMNSVQLIQALGGGWNVSQMPSDRNI